MDSVGTTKSKSAQKTRIRPHSPVLVVLFPIGSFLLAYAMLLPLVGIMFLVWLYVTDVVLDGNTHGMAFHLMKIKKYAGRQFRRCVPAGTPCRDRVQLRSLSMHEVRTLVHTLQGSRTRSCGVSYGI